MIIIAPQPPKSFGNYLTLLDALTEIGSKCVEGWTKSDPKQLLAVALEGDSPARDRCDSARERLKHWLSGNELPAYGRDREGAFHTLGTERLSAPFFDIDVLKSQFRWAPDEWDVIFVGRKELLAQIASTRKGRPRRTTFKWQDATHIAWMTALDASPPRKRSSLIVGIQMRCQEELGCEPGEKEIASLVDTIIAHLGDRALSRDV
jgi:hypothetical protein